MNKNKYTQIYDSSIPTINPKILDGMLRMIVAFNIFSIIPVIPNITLYIRVRTEDIIANASSS